jgi:hypothetical protein
MTNKEKSCQQLICELDILIEQDFQKAKQDLEDFKNSPSVFNLFEINENTEDPESQIFSIFADDEVRSTDHE